MVRNYNKYDAEFCGGLPIHLTNAIQPHGGFLLISESLDRILQVSENIETLTGRQPEQIAGHSPDEIIANESLLQLKQIVVNGLFHRIPKGLALEEELPGPHTSEQLEFSEVPHTLSRLN